MDRNRWFMKKPRPFNKARFICRSKATLLVSSLGCFERINFCFWCWSSLCDMWSKVAISGFPFQWRIRACRAVPSGSVFNATIAAFTVLHDLVANSAIVRTPLCSHKRALKTFSNRCTNHCNHPLSEKNQKKAGSHLFPASNRQVLKKLGQYNQTDKGCQ